MCANSLTPVIYGAELQDKLIDHIYFLLNDLLNGNETLVANARSGTVGLMGKA